MKSDPVSDAVADIINESALQLFKFNINYNILELFIHSALAKLLDDDGLVTEAIFENIVGVSQKISILRSVAKNKKNNSHDISALLPNIEKIVKFRNILLHSIIQIDDTGNNILYISNILRGNKARLKKYTITPQDIKDMVSVSANTNKIMNIHYPLKLKTKNCQFNSEI